MNQNHKFEVHELPYAYDALMPEVSEETLRFHHDKHYAGYVNKLNELIANTEFEGAPLEEIICKSQGGVFNNAAQAWNHEFFFAELSGAPQAEPTGKLLEAVERDFGSVAQLKEQMNQAAAGLFGAGWVWLVKDGEGKLSIVQKSNAGNPLTEGLTPVMCFDVWEHAYYIDYRNRRPDAVNMLWNKIDWKVLEERYAK